MALSYAGAEKTINCGFAVVVNVELTINVVGAYDFLEFTFDVAEVWDAHSSLLELVEGADEVGDPTGANEVQSFHVDNDLFPLLGEGNDAFAQDILILEIQVALECDYGNFPLVEQTSS